MRSIFKTAFFENMVTIVTFAIFASVFAFIAVIDQSQFYTAMTGVAVGSMIGNFIGGVITAYKEARVLARAEAMLSK